MNVFILTEGGKNIGFGHIARCTALYQAFEDMGVKPVLIVNGDKSAAHFLKGKRVKVFDWVGQPGSSLNACGASTVVIVDSYLAPGKVYRFFRDNCNLLVCVDDNRRIKYPARTLVVNGNLFAKDLYSGTGSEKLLGPNYMLLRKSFWKLPQRIIRKRMSRVLIVAGGDDAKNLTPYLANVLAKEFPEVHVKVVVGYGFRNIKELESLPGKRIELVYFPDANGMKRLMFWADIAVTACGQTLYELARTGLPMVGVMVADNQFNNVRGWKKTAAFKYAGNWIRGSEKRIVCKISKYLTEMGPFAVRLEMSLSGRSIVDGKGPERIVCEIQKRVDSNLEN